MRPPIEGLAYWCDAADAELDQHGRVIRLRNRVDGGITALEAPSEEARPTVGLLSSSSSPR